MNDLLYAHYADNPQYAPRLGTDALFLYAPATLAYSGIADETVRLIQKIQLTDAPLWALFVRQFRSHPDDANRGWRCEYWGKMMRGAALTYSVTRSEELYDTMRDTVLDLLTAQDKYGRFSTYSVEAEFDGWDLWGRKYILLGLLHFHGICDDGALRDRILAACSAHAHYIIDHIGLESEGKKNITAASRHWGGINSSSILEPMVRLFSATGDPAFFDFAAYIIENGGSKNGNIFDFALRGEKYPFEYPDYKAYELMSCFEGLIEYYRITHEAKWLTALRNFTRMLRDSDITVIGCAGCTHELLDNSALRQTYTKYEGIMQETCVSVTWMKLCTQMLQLTGDAIYADEVERTARNALWGAVNTEGCTTNMGYPFDSYSPLWAGVRGRKVGGLQYMEEKTATYGCCACIGAAGTALLPLTNILLSRCGLAVNYYLPGEAVYPTPAGQSCTVRTVTEYPADGRVRIELSLIGPEAFCLSLRIPYFGIRGAVRVNGVAVEGAEPGTYLHLSRIWSDGDRIELCLDMTPRLYRGAPLPDDEASEHMIAVGVGPLMLARDARVSGDVGEAVQLKLDGEGHPVVHPAETPDFPVQCAYSVETQGGAIRMIDYASAGKTWDERSKMECWMHD